jgi:L-fucose mutarotase
MLIDIHPLLHADLLHALRSMGHTDTIVVADGNFPANALGRRVTRVDGADAPTVVRAILSVMPVDAGAAPIVGMRTDAADGRDAVTKDFEAAAGQPLELSPPVKFYEMARNAFIVVQTGEKRFYGNLLIRKGVIPPPTLP